MRRLLSRRHEYCFDRVEVLLIGILNYPSVSYKIGATLIVTNTAYYGFTSNFEGRLIIENTKLLQNLSKIRTVLRLCTMTKENCNQIKC